MTEIELVVAKIREDFGTGDAKEMQDLLLKVIFSVSTIFATEKTQFGKA